MAAAHHVLAAVRLIQLCCHHDCLLASISCHCYPPALTSCLAAQVSLKTANGSTALHNAATNGHDAIVEVLLLAGCSINARAVSGATPLYGAASGGHLAVVRRLLAAGAEVRTAWQVQGLSGLSAHVRA